MNEGLVCLHRNLGIFLRRWQYLSDYVQDHVARRMTSHRLPSRVSINLPEALDGFDPLTGPGSWNREPRPAKGKLRLAASQFQAKLKSGSSANPHQRSNFLTCPRRAYQQNTRTTIIEQSHLSRQQSLYKRSRANGQTINLGPSQKLAS